MTQDLSAGTSSPQPVPGTPASTPPARTPTIKAPATRTPDIEKPATAASVSQAKPTPGAPAQAASAQIEAAGATSAQATATQAKLPGRNASATKPSTRRALSRKGKSRRKPSAPRRGGRRAQSQTGRSAGVAPDAGTVAERRIRIGSPASLLAVVPVLLGFEPGDSMVVIGVGQPGAEVRLTLRYDLPDPGLAPAVAAHAMSVLTAQRIQAAVAVGYGPEHLVSPVAAALRDCAPGAGVTVTELLRADNQRYWS